MTAPDAMLADLLRGIRQERQWTQEDLAQRLGVTRAQVANAECGNTDMRASVVVRLLAETGHLR